MNIYKGIMNYSKGDEYISENKGEFKELKCFSNKIYNIKENDKIYIREIT